MERGRGKNIRCGAAGKKVDRSEMLDERSPLYVLRS